MLTAMIDQTSLWLFLVGFGLGAAVVGVLLWRLPRREDDVSLPERSVEAAWIASTIERHGGSAPGSFVEEVLDLHAAYLQAPHVPGPPRGAAPPPVPPPPPGRPVAPPGPPPGRPVAPPGPPPGQPAGPPPGPPAGTPVPPSAGSTPGP
jgi:hypothetical protein